MCVVKQHPCMFNALTPVHNCSLMGQSPLQLEKMIREYKQWFVLWGKDWMV